MKKSDLTRIYNKHFDSLCCCALSIVGDKSIAEDIVQEAFIKLLKYEKNTNSSFFFLRRTVYNLSLNHIRDNKRRYERELNYVNISQLDEIDKDQLELKIEKLTTALSKMPEEIQKTVVLKAIEKLKYAEISDELGTSIHNVKARLQKAYKTIREEIILFLLIPNNCISSN